MNQLTQEMQRIQMEYAANPTPENLAKMQTEMARIQQEMMAAAMGATTPAGVFGADSPFLADAMAGMQAAGEYGQLLGAMFGEDDEEMAEFIAAHPPAPGKAKHLPIGAFLLNTNGEPCETFAMMGEKEDWLEAMADGWEITDPKAAREMLESLIDGRHTQVFDEDYLNLKAGRPHELDDDSVEAYADMLDTLYEELPQLLPHAQNCSTILAWDLERAGYLARIFLHLGWLTEAEAFEWLEKTAVQIKQVFSSWEEYAVSIMVGRALHFEDADPVISAACELFDEGNMFLSEHPFSNL